MQRKDEIVAAGGIILRAEGAELPCRSSVLLVHRPKYNDWSFPKGKLDAGETIEAAALREVEEETGLRCRIIRKLPSIRYQYSGGTGIIRPKIVHYFLMEAVSGEIAVNLHEIDEARWYESDEALALLNYEHDRHLLASLLEQQTDAKS